MAAITLAAEETAQELEEVEGPVVLAKADEVQVRLCSGRPKFYSLLCVV